MLSKINNIDSIKLSTNNIQNISLKIEFDIIHDNLHGYILVKNGKEIFLLNYKNNKKYKYNRIQVHFNDITISKQIESFDQNNVLIANKLRSYVLLLCKNTIETILGIGGEYYLYFPFIKATNYIGISNHQSIIQDANYNVHFSSNYYVDYNDIETYPNISCVDIIILNVYNLHVNIIKYIKQIKFNKLIIISCDLPDNKLKLLSNNFKIKKIKYFNNFNKFIRIIII